MCISVEKISSGFISEQKRVTLLPIKIRDKRRELSQISNGWSRLRFEDIVIDGFRVRLFHIGGLKVGVALDIGPRILYLALNNDQFNLFSIVPDVQIETPDGLWRIYGGHRLWTAPESFPRTYSIDDKPVTISVDENSVVITGNPEHQNSVLKRIRLEPGDDEYSLKVIHEVVNIGRWPIEFACWAISVMQPGGTAVVPLKPRKIDKHGLLPDRVISVWPYTKLNDPRIKLGEDYIVVEHDQTIQAPVKIGAKANPPLAAYVVNKFLFVKQIQPEPGRYPDHGVTVELYANNRFLELETLSPLRIVEPGESNIHVEVWKIRKLEDYELDVQHVVKELFTHYST